MRDLFNNLVIKPVLSPSAGPSDDTPQVGAIIDTQGLRSLLYILATGTLVDANATFGVLLEHGDAANLSDAAAVPDEQLLGTEALAGFAFGDDDKCRKLGYRVGGKRYTRITITPAGNSGAAPMAVVAIGVPEVVPTANPPA